MNFRYSLVTLCILLGVAGNAIAEERYPELIGDWSGTGFPGCSPCLLSIQGVQDDGQLVLKSSVVGDLVESWGRVTRDGEKIDVRITLADGSTFDLRLSRSGKYLEGTFLSYAQHGDGIIVSLTRVKAQK